jgi:hypothetical protein
MTCLYLLKLKTSPRVLYLYVIQVLQPLLNELSSCTKGQAENHLLLIPRFSIITCAPQFTFYITRTKIAPYSISIVYKNFIENNVEMISTYRCIDMPHERVC